MLQLTANEVHLFSTLKELAAKLNILNVRAVGGWVRDKLLNLPSHDIDIAVEDYSAEVFAQELEEFTGESNSVAVIEENAAKNKLQSAVTTKVFEYEIDFVSIVDPVDDANRRDLTINALFYDIVTEEVEDFTNFGLQDLYNRVIRTPVAPELTYANDPLRMLRTLRFCAKFGFALEDSVVSALQSPEVVNRFSNIARNRVGNEIVSLFSYGGLLILCQFPLLFHQVLEAPLAAIANYEFQTEAWIAHISQKLGSMLEAENIDELLSEAASSLGIQNYDTNGAKSIVYFYAVTSYFGSETHVLDATKIEHLEGMCGKSRNRTMVDKMHYLVPFVCCAQGIKLSNAVKYLSESLADFYVNERVFYLQSTENIEVEVAFTALSSVENGEYFGRAQEIAQFYQIGLLVLKHKPIVKNIPALATRCRISEKEQYSALKNEACLFELSMREFPNIPENWEDLFVEQRFLSGKSK